MDPSRSTDPRARSLDRRQVLAAGGALLACPRLSVAAAPAARRSLSASRLDDLLIAHRDALPENTAGANHYPMAAEVLESLGQAHAIPEDWIEGARGYAGEWPRRAPLGLASFDRAAIRSALGERERAGDWLDHFRARLSVEPWPDVVRTWLPHLAPGLAGAAWHGLIRTAHAVRALERADSPARRDELAAALAYWASGHLLLPTGPVGRAGPSLGEHLERQRPAGADDDVPFDQVDRRLAALPPLDALPSPTDPGAALHELLRAASASFLELLVAERHRIWFLHTVTAPAAVDLLLPLADEATARALVRHARHSVLTLHAALGRPHRAGAHLRDDPPPWKELVEETLGRGSVHTLKLVEALQRTDPGTDTLARSVAVQWLEWR